MAQTNPPIAGLPVTDPLPALPQPPTTATGTKTILGNVTINITNQSDYDGRILLFTAAYTVTIDHSWGSLRPGFGFGVLPPLAGNVSIAVTGGATINSGTATLTRALASNATFAVIKDDRTAGSYTVTGS